MAPQAKELWITDDGGAELCTVDGSVLWASDSDETFRGEFPDLLDDGDVDAVVEYLEKHGHVAPGELVE